ncbi:hypothetical protein ANO11243_057900 [Dothideomycetidae sp. 11243]|nr:hypothetical protein ANO11243_057900 [fungal sp. No.11243]
MPGDINVAYDGTSADLGSNEVQSFSWEDLCSSTESLAPVNNFTPINDSIPSTISPKDLFMDSSSSVPPSTAFTNLTTPGSVYLGTPDDFDVSPMYDYDSLDAPEVWPSLFEHEEPATSNGAEMSRTTSETSHIVIHPGGLSRKRSSPHDSPLTPNTRPSSISGISKREKALAPIVVDSADPVAVKRARNTAAARKSRDKKFKEVETYRLRIAELEQEVEHWKSVALAAGKN